VITSPSQRKELRYINLKYQSLLDNEGTTLFASGKALKSEPGESLTDLGLESVSYGLEAGIKFVLIRRRDENLNFNISFSHSNTDTDALDVPILQDRTRSFGVDGEYQFSDNFGGAASASLGARRGLNWLGETPDRDVLLARADAVSDATWFNIRVSRLQGLDSIVSGLSVQANISGQYSLDALSSSREFGVGGLANASAFNSSEISGDHGLSGRLELRYSTALPMLDDIVPGGILRGSGVQFYGFSDGGYVWQEDAEVTGQKNDRIGSAGVGARFNIGAHYSGSIEAAQPYAQPVSSEVSRGARIFVQLFGRF
jgi:hemolysin activation/secretion protein